MSLFVTIYPRTDEKVYVNIDAASRWTAVQFDGGGALHLNAVDGWTPELVAEWLEDMATQVREKAK
jgi:hypothetical protein